MFNNSILVIFNDTWAIGILIGPPCRTVFQHFIIYVSINLNNLYTVK